MTSTIKMVLVFGAGFASGWTARSLADSPHDAGVKLLAIAMNAKERISRWAAVERERIEDMFAEARSTVESAMPTSSETKSTNGFGRAVVGEA